MERYIDLEREVQQEQEENLEDQLEKRWEREDIKSFSAQVLFFVQGLGVETIVNTDTEQVKTYVKGEHCEASLKDLCRVCKNDEFERPMGRIFLAQWKVLQKDLISLLLGYPQDKVLTYYVVILLESLTNTSSMMATRPQDKDIIMNALYEYKICFLRPMVLETLTTHFADCLQAVQKTRAHIQMIELIVLIFRNLLQIPDLQSSTNFTGPAEIKTNLQRSLIEVMIKQQFLAGLIYLSNDFQDKSPAQNLGIVLIEIFYRVFTGFDQEWLLRDQEQDRIKFMEMIVAEQARRNKIKSMVPARHSKFGGLFKQKRQFDGSFTISSQPFTEKRSNYNPHQRQKPFLKSVAQKHQTIFTKRMDLQEDPEFGSSMREELYNLATNFMTESFSPLINKVSGDIAKDSEKIEPNDKIYYFVLVAYFLKFARLYSKRKLELQQRQCLEQRQAFTADLSSEYAHVAAALQLSQFEIFYSNMVRECTQIKKRFFNYRNFFAVINLFYEFLCVTRDLSLSQQQVDRKNAQILMQNIFQHDVSKTFKIGFQYCAYGLFNDQLLAKLIQLTSLFFDMLEGYSQGKSLAIKTNKILKKKKKKEAKKAQKKAKEHAKAPQQEVEDIEQDMFEQQSNPSYQGSDDEDEDDDKDEINYKERKFNLMSEFAMVVEYNILEKIFYLLRGEYIIIDYNSQLLSMNPELVHSIYKYFHRILELLKADWLFYQTDFLFCMNQILQRQEIAIRVEFRPLLTVFKKIARSFILCLKSNKLLAVEALFRFPDSATKDQIIQNYPEALNLAEENDYINEDELRRWTRQEDEILIENYYKYKDCDQPEEQLSLYLGSLGFAKSPMEVKKRIKKYKLYKVDSDVALRRLINKVDIVDSLRDLLEETSAEDIKEFFEELFVKSEKLIQLRGQAQVDLAIPPITNLWFDLLEKEHIQQIMSALQFKSPSVGQIYWRLNAMTTLEDLEQQKLKFDTSFEQSLKQDKPVSPTMPTLIEPTLENLPVIDFEAKKKDRLQSTPLKNHNSMKVPVEASNLKSENKKMIELEVEDEYDDLFD